MRTNALPDSNPPRTENQEFVWEWDDPDPNKAALTTKTRGGEPGRRGYHLVDHNRGDTRPSRSNTTPLQASGNDSHTQRVPSNLNAIQHNTGSTDIYEGENISGPIHGGNIGGRRNTNNIYNGSTSFPSRRQQSSQNNGISELEEELFTIEEEIENCMSEYGWGNQEKLKKRIEAGKRLRDELRGGLRR